MFHEFRVIDSCLVTPPQSCPLNSRSQIEKPLRVPHELAQPGRCASRPCRGWKGGAHLRGKTPRLKVLKGRGQLDEEVEESLRVGVMHLIKAAAPLRQDPS
ncbi:hypothetical protein MC885_020616 [Smutsia gigantea]|nr:hypothetical protein MC885_020616 [Smutsia gigantea]